MFLKASYKGKLGTNIIRGGDWSTEGVLNHFWARWDEIIAAFDISENNWFTNIFGIKFYVNFNIISPLQNKHLGLSENHECWKQIIYIRYTNN